MSRMMNPKKNFKLDQQDTEDYWTRLLGIEAEEVGCPIYSETMPFFNLRDYKSTKALRNDGSRQWLHCHDAKKVERRRRRRKRA